MIGGGQPSSSNKSTIWDMATVIDEHPLFSSAPVPLTQSQLQPGAQQYRLTGEERDYITDVLFAKYLQREIVRDKQRNNFGKCIWNKSKSVKAIDPENPNRAKFTRLVSLQLKQNFMLCLFNQTLRIFSELDGVKQDVSPEETNRVRRYPCEVCRKFVYG